MNKACFMSFVLAMALPAMAAENTYTNFLTGVKSVEGDGTPTADGGAWAPNDAALSKTNDAVAFETAATPMRLNVTAAPADTNTVVKVEIEATLADVGELMTQMPDNAQVAFAVCTNSYNAWNGSAWVALDEVPAGVDGTQITNLTVEISYQGNSERKACFYVGDTLLHPRAGGSEWVVLAGDGATSKNNLSAMGIDGAGVIAKADASVMLGVASYDGVKYGTISNAVVAAGKNLDATIEVLRETEESIDDYAADGITVHSDPSVPVTIKATDVTADGGQAQGASGAYTADVRSNVTAENLNVTLPGEMGTYKEVTPGSVNVDNGTATFTVRTKSSIVAAVSPAGKELSANVEKLHEFLGKTAATKTAYEKANPTAGELATELAKNGANNIPLYQSYALGIDQDTPVKPVTVANDEAQNAITISIPALETSTLSGDYATVKYVLTKPNSETVEFNKGQAIQVPLATGSYQVKIVME